MTTVARKDFLARLLAVDAGLTKRATIQQSDCVALKRGRFYTFSQEISCSILSGLPNDLEGAVDAGKISQYLKLSPDDSLEVKVENNCLILKGKHSRKTKFALQELLLPIDSVDRPKGWISLSPGFSEAVDLVHRCTRKKKAFANECVHVHPEWLEASDDLRAMRYRIGTFVEKSCLVRGSSVKEMVQLGMTKGWESPEWLHFGNPFGLRMSIRKFPMDRDWPPIEQFFTLRGREVEFPKSIAEIAKRAGVFESIEGDIEVAISNDKLYVLGRDEGGEHSEEEDIRYRGSPVRFIVPPKLVQELVGQSTKVELTDVSIRVDGGPYVYVASIELKK